jgi:hypothetical protein
MRQLAILIVALTALSAMARPPERHVMLHATESMPPVNVP